MIGKNFVTFNDFHFGEISQALLSFGATSIPLLDEGSRLQLLREAQNASYRPEPKVVGSGANTVRQELETCEDFGSNSGFWLVKNAFEQALAQSLSDVKPYPFDKPLDLNTMVLQKYERGSAGITPHRDRLVYINLICLFVLGGCGRFFVCADRSGAVSREIDARPGNVIFIRAPGFFGSRERPFHYVKSIEETRYIFGLRQKATEESNRFAESNWRDQSLPWGPPRLRF